MVVGTKAELKRGVDDDQLQEFIGGESLPYFEVDVKSGNGVKQLRQGIFNINLGVDLSMGLDDLSDSEVESEGEEDEEENGF